MATSAPVIKEIDVKPKEAPIPVQLPPLPVPKPAEPLVPA